MSEIGDSSATAGLPGHTPCSGQGPALHVNIAWCRGVHTQIKAMEDEEALCCTASFLGCGPEKTDQTSIIITFTVPEFGSDSQFCAWLTSNGRLSIARAKQDFFDSKSTSFSLNTLDVINIATHEAQHQSSTSPTAGPSLLAFGGGPRQLLAVATPSHLTIISLQGVIKPHIPTHNTFSCTLSDPSSPLQRHHHEVGGGQGHREDGLVDGARNDVIATTTHTLGHVVALSWTRALDGILISSSNSHVTMFRLDQCSVNTLNDNKPVQFGDEYKLAVAWQVVAPEPQNLLTAGLSMSSPSASCASRDRTVSVWWPQQAKQEGGDGLPNVSREKLKHPCGITGLEWCPGVLQRDSLTSPIHPTSSDQNQGTASTTTQPSDETLSSSSGLSLAEDHPALMTVGEDGAIRIWVEMLLVQHSMPQHAGTTTSTSNPTSPSGLSSALTATSQKDNSKQRAAGNNSSSPSVPPTTTTTDSYFCMTLVIDPPASPFTSTTSPNTDPTGAVPSADSGSGLHVTRAWWAHSINQRQSSTSLGSFSSTPGALWLLTSHQTHPNSTDITIRLYAVRGLSAVVVASYAGVVSGAGAVQGSGGAGGGRRPQAVLWGEHFWQLPIRKTSHNHSKNENDLAPVSQCCHFSLPVFSAWVSAENDFPLVHLLSAAAGGEEASGLATVIAAGLTFATVSEDSAMPLSPTALQKRLTVLKEWNAQATLHTTKIVSLKALSRLELVATADAGGSVAIWHGEDLRLAAALSLTDLHGIVSNQSSRGRIDAEDGVRLKGVPKLAWLHPVGHTGAILAATAGNNSVAFFAISPLKNVAKLLQVAHLPATPAALHLLRAHPNIYSDEVHLAAILEPDSGSTGIGNGIAMAVLICRPGDKVQSLQVQVLPPLTLQLAAGVRVLTSTAYPGAKSGLLLGCSDGTVLYTAVTGLGVGGAGGQRVVPLPRWEVLSTSHLAHHQHPHRPAVDQEERLRLEGNEAQLRGVSFSYDVPAMIACEPESGLMAVLLQDGREGRGAVVHIWPAPTASHNHNHTMDGSLSNKYGGMNSSTKQHSSHIVISQPRPGVTSSKISNKTFKKLEPQPSCVAWLKRCIVPCLAVGYIDGSVRFYASSRSAAADAAIAWRSMAYLPPPSSAPVREVNVSVSGRVFVASGSEVTAIQAVQGSSHEGSGTRLLKNTPLARHLMHVAGPLPHHHPSIIKALILSGRIESAATLLKAIADEVSSSEQDADSPTVLQNTLLENIGLSLRELLDMDQAQSLISLISNPVTSDFDKAAARIQASASSAGISTRPTTGSLSKVAGAATIAAQQQWQQEEAGVVLRSSSLAIDTGALDMGAFGFDMDPDPLSLSTVSNPKPTEPDPSVHIPQVDSGMLDLAAFGMEIAPPPEPLQEQEQSTARGVGLSSDPGGGVHGVNSGMLDLAAFGMDFMPPAPPPDPQQQQDEEEGRGQSEGLSSPPPTPCLAPSMTGSNNNNNKMGSSSRGGLDVIGASASTARANREKVLGAPGQIMVPLTTLCAVPSAAVDQLMSILVNEDSGTGQAGAGAIPFVLQGGFGSSGAAAAAGGGGVVERWLNSGDGPLPHLQKCIPGLTSNETALLLSMALAFSENGPLSRTGVGQVDAAGGRYVTALMVACCEETSTALLPKCRDGIVENGDPSFIKNTFVSGENRSISVQTELSRMKRDGVAPVSAWLEGTTSTARTAASKGSSASSVGEYWGLLPGLRATAVLWALLSGTQQVLLEVGLAVLREREAVQEAAKLKSIQDMEGSSFDRASSDLAALKRAQLSSASMSSQSSDPLNGITWPQLRSLGAGFWLQDPPLLQSTADALAKSQFAARRVAAECALVYCAMGKRSVLQGLCRSTQDIKLAEFLSRDFNKPQHQQAAMKNAYVLLGQHRYELAAAFFILGGSPAEAVGVCAHEMHDVQLALFISRLIAGPGNDMERDVLVRHALPAEKESSPDWCWARGVAAWLSSDAAAATQALLQVPTHRPESLESAIQMLPMLTMLCSVPASISPAAVPAALHQLQCRCASAAEDLSTHGLQGLALQHLLTMHTSSTAAKTVSKTSTGTSPSLEGSVPSVSLSQLCAGALVLQTISGLKSGQHHQQQLGSSGDPKLLTTISSSSSSSRAVSEDPSFHLQPSTQPLGRNTSSTASATPLSVLPLNVAMQVEALKQAGLPLDTHATTTHLIHMLRQLQLLPDSTSCSKHTILDVSGGRGSMDLMTPERGAPGGGCGGSGYTSVSLTRQGSGLSIDTQRSVQSASSRHAHTLLERKESSRMGLSSAAPGAVLGESTMVLRVEGDAVHAVCCCALMSPDVPGRPIVVASHKSGILETAAQAPIELPPLAESESTLSLSDLGNRSGVFSRLLSQIFDHSSWTNNEGIGDPLLPWGSSNASDGDLGLAVASAMASSDGSGGFLQPVVASPTEVHSKVLCSHPTRQLFLSGAASGRVLLWQFGGPKAVASYTPVPPHELAAAHEAGGLLSFSMRFSRTASVTARLASWGKCQGLAFSPNGDRFAAVGDGGVVATWRLGQGGARATDVDGAICAEWWQHCLSKEGCAVEFIGGSSSTLAAGGRCPTGNLSFWDSAAPPGQACVGRMHHHKKTVTALKAAPGGWLLAAGDIDGALSVTDIRKLGGPASGDSSAAVLWSVRASRGALHSLTILQKPIYPLIGGSGSQDAKASALGVADGSSLVFVSGGHDGAVRAWQASSGKLLQSIEGVHLKPRRLSLDTGGASASPYGMGGAPGGVAAPVTGVAACEEGVVSCGADGSVRLHPFVV